MFEQDEDPEDIFSTSLPLLFDYEPVTHADAGATFTYRFKGIGQNVPPFSVCLQVPDTLARNNGLHASSIWSSALYLADHLKDLGLWGWAEEWLSSGKRCDILELGAGAGLPGITLAKTLETIAENKRSWMVTLSDYPDINLIRALQKNVEDNNLRGDRCLVLPYDWGKDVSSLLAPTIRSGENPGYDLIVAADTLWNSELHMEFIRSLRLLLRKDSGAQINLIAGFHTGRFAIQRFLDLVSSRNLASGDRELEIAHVEERMVASPTSLTLGVTTPTFKAWDPERDDYDMKERRKWVAWIVLRWSR